MNKMIWIIGIVLLIHLSLFAQPDNGNIFQLSWKASLSQHVGATTDMGLYAPENLDIDKDGKKEFLLFDHDKFSFTPFGRVQLWENDGDNSFKIEWEIKYCAWACQYEPGAGLTVTDFDFDGNQEVFIAVESKLYIYESDGNSFESGGGLPLQPTATFYPVQDQLGAANISTLIVQNLDPDPDLEIFMGYNYNKGLYCVIGSLPGSDLSVPDWKLEFADDFDNVEVSPGGGYRVGGVVIDDFDQDGKMEIFTSHWQDLSATRVYENDGIDNYVIKHTNTPETLILYPPFDGSFANSIFYDFDGDGDSEFLISDIHGHIFLITRSSSNNFEDFGKPAWIYLMNWPTVPDNGFIRSGALGDLDQDGKPDIYYNDFRAQAILDLEYQGGPLTDPNSWIAYEIYKWPGVRFGNVRPAGDLDGDGLEELVCNMGGLINGQNLHILESQHRPSAVGEQKFAEADGFTLHQNYPNPFNPTTTIRYNLSKADHVSLKIFNLQGEEIAALVAGENQAAGDHSVDWNGSDSHGRLVTSGVYIYQLQTGENIVARKMSFIK